MVSFSAVLCFGGTGVVATALTALASKINRTPASGLATPSISPLVKVLHTGSLLARCGLTLPFSLWWPLLKTIPCLLGIVLFVEGVLWFQGALIYNELLHLSQALLLLSLIHI